jgi:glutamate dehydrogenase/leucine dehydrogenase
MAEKLLEVKNLRTSFFTAEGEVKSVNDVSYYVNRGEMIAIVGESGCGKSVTQMSVLQLVQSPPGKKSWEVRADVYMPCATQNEVTLEDAKRILASGSRYYIEVSNMPTTNEALAYLQRGGMIVAPSKAVNAGGVAVSALEMSQNAMHYKWPAEEVDEKLKAIMKNIHAISAGAAAEYGLGYNLVAGANIAGFQKLADAMMAQGIV